MNSTTQLHSISDDVYSRHHKKQNSKATSTSHAKMTKTKGSSKQLQSLFAIYDEVTALFYQTALSKRLESMLKAKNRPLITRIISLGLGSLGPSKDQLRRIKQLVILMSIASYISSSTSNHQEIVIYAQDPAFTKTDEEFLRRLGVQVLTTTTASDLGEAGRMINDETLVYSPFLTLAAYQQLFAPFEKTSGLQGPEATIPVLIGDDFSALRLKWEKRTSEHKDVEGLVKTMKARNYQSRSIEGEGFWEETDSPFPMSMYWSQSSVRQGGRRVRGNGISTKL